MTTEKADFAIARADRVMRSLDERGGAAREAARRERTRLNASLGRTLLYVGAAVLVISIATIVVGMITPIGMFGFLGAIGLAIGVAALILFSGRGDIAAPRIATDLPNAEMVQRFDSYIFRARKALPAPAQAELDLLSARLPTIRETLSRVPDGDPNAQDARRLMSTHLPNLIDRYVHVPKAYRGETDGEGVAVDQRLTEALAAGRKALDEISENLARNDLAAFETQGRFIQNRYKDDAL